jgi:hypothetical protein
LPGDFVRLPGPREARPSHCTKSTVTLVVALHCTALHCTALHCTALHCTALHCTALHCNEMHCNALQCTAMQWQCSAVQCRAATKSFNGYPKQPLRERERLPSLDSHPWTLCTSGRRFTLKSAAAMAAKRMASHSSSRPMQGNAIQCNWMQDKWQEGS